MSAACCTAQKKNALAEASAFELRKVSRDVYPKPIAPPIIGL